MNKFLPVQTLDDLASLDEAEMIEGYRDGLAGDPEHGNNRSRSYWHGWRNGAVDRGYRDPDDAQVKLAHAIVDSRKSHYDALR